MIEGYVLRPCASFEREISHHVRRYWHFYYGAHVVCSCREGSSPIKVFGTGCQPYALVHLFNLISGGAPPRAFSSALVCECLNGPGGFLSSEEITSLASKSRSFTMRNSASCIYANRRHRAIDGPITAKLAVRKSEASAWPFSADIGVAPAIISTRSYRHRRTAASLAPFSRAVARITRNTIADRLSNLASVGK